MKKYNVKTFLIVIVPLIIMCVIAFMFSQKDRNYITSFIINGSNYWRYKNKRWEDLSSSNDIDWQKYDVYSKNRYINNYYVTITNNKSYFFDSQNDSYEVDSPYIAIKSDTNIRLLNYNEHELDNNDIRSIKRYLKKIKIKYNGEYSIQKKYITDINNDNIEDNLYIVSNELYTDDNLFYIVFAKCNTRLITIDNQIKKDTFIHYDLAWVLNMEHNGFNNIILTEPKEYDTKYYLFSYNIDAKNYNYVFKS